MESSERRQCRIEGPGGVIRSDPEDVEAGIPVALEAAGNWDWIADEIKQAGCRPVLVQVYKAKILLGIVNKTDGLDVHGFNRLPRAGTVPAVRVPLAEVRDRCERTRMVVVRARTRLKCRIQAM